MSGDSNLKLGRAFYAALVAHDWVWLRSLICDDARWILPGNSTISGRISGADAVIEQARRITGYGLTSTLEHILVSEENVALSVHHSAEHDGVRLDEHLATVCRIRDGRIAEIETFLSDVKGMNAFFI